MRRRRLPFLDADAPPTALPSPASALDYPPGLLAAGGALTPDWLRHAYRHGIFPWYSAGEPILWWSPPERMVFRPEALRVPRSLRQSARNRGYLIGFDTDFLGTMAGCASRGKSVSLLNQGIDSMHSTPTDTVAGDSALPSASTATTAADDEAAPDGTWIVPEMTAAYAALHAAGDAHSVEVWKDGELVGGLYGVSLGGLFWGESMFSRARDASKVALLALAAECRDRGIGLIDAQFHTPHLESLGGVKMPRAEFLAEVGARTRGVTTAALARPWQRPPHGICKFA